MLRLCILALFSTTIYLVADEPKGEKDPRPQYERVLSADDAKKAAELRKKVDEANAAQEFDKAKGIAKELLSFHEERLGADHWRTIDQKRLVELLERAASLPAADQKSWRDLQESFGKLNGMLFKGDYGTARLLSGHYTAQCLRLFGDRPVTANGFDGMASAMFGLGDFGQAHFYWNRALSVQRKGLGESHPVTGRTYVNIARALMAGGNFVDAETFARKAVDIAHATVGPQSYELARCWARLSQSLRGQGRLGEARTYAFRSLTTEAAMWYDPLKAEAALELGQIFATLGKHDEARNFFGMALNIREYLFGTRHLSTAECFEYYAKSATDSGEHPRAVAWYQRAIDTIERAAGLNHPLTAPALVGLSKTLARLGKHDEAMRHLSKAQTLLASSGRLRHPLFAEAFLLKGRNLAALGMHTQAAAHLNEALKVSRSQLGDAHPASLECAVTVAASLHFARETDLARKSLVSAAAAYEASRVQAAGIGLDSAEFGAERSPYPLLAAVEAGARRPSEAWAAAEADLARGLLDQVSLLSSGRWPPELLDLLKNTRDESAALDPRIFELSSSMKKLDMAEEKELSDLRGARSKLAARFADAAAALARREVADLTTVQTAIPADAALIFWLDCDPPYSGVSEHWACVVRPSGEPRWERLPGSGPDGKWTREDTALPTAYRTALAANVGFDEIDGLAKRVLAQRLAPIEKHLHGARSLYVASVNVMAGVPIESLLPQCTVHYVPSGTYIAHLKGRQASAAGKAFLLGDPLFPKTQPQPKDSPAPNRGPDLPDLPGTRAEIASLSKLFDGRAIVLQDADASERRVDNLREKGDLSGFRYFHFGTHGAAKSVKAFESVLYLAHNEGRETALEPGKPLIDGMLSAQEVLRYWKLDAELVTLSACETALGKSAGGDGLLGFAQAFLTAGARSVCLSLWKVDDTATCLLMTRFYQNLLGKREGLAKPMPKAEALREAKKWLRNLSADEAKNLTADMTKGVTRGDRGKGATLELVVPNEPKADTQAKDAKPFAHPRYWAAFILIGDPN